MEGEVNYEISRPAPGCQKCGERFNHDDDGPILCRFCDAAPDHDTSTQAHAETGR